MAFLICYYEDKIEFWNNDILYEKFMQSCHYLWICELLKEKFDIELTLREFRYSGVSMEDDFFESSHCNFDLLTHMHTHSISEAFHHSSL